MPGGITPTWEWAKTNARINNEYVREAISEFLGTMLLCFMVVGAGMQSVLWPDSSLQPVLGTVFGLMVSIIIFGGVSGAHINPSVTFGLALAGQLKWQKVPVYALSQLVGGIIGSLIAFGLIKEHLVHHFKIPSGTSISDFDELNGLQVYTAFTGRPATALAVGLASEICLVTILLMTVLAVSDQRNMKIPSFLIPFMFALTVAALALAQAVPSGSLLNPVRDMAPRLAALILGWSTDACFMNINFDGEEQHWWIVGLFGPIIGATIGVFLYIFLVGAQLPYEDGSLELKPVYVENDVAKSDDWRHTAFIPRPGAVAAAPNGATPQQQYYNGAGPVQTGNGHFNPSYVRDDTQRQGY